MNHPPNQFLWQMYLINVWSPSNQSATPYIQWQKEKRYYLISSAIYQQRGTTQRKIKKLYCRLEHQYSEDKAKKKFNMRETNHGFQELGNTEGRHTSSSQLCQKVILACWQLYARPYTTGEAAMHIQTEERIAVHMKMLMD